MIIEKNYCYDIHDFTSDVGQTFLEEDHEDIDFLVLKSRNPRMASNPTRHTSLTHIRNNNKKGEERK